MKIKFKYNGIFLKLFNTIQEINEIRNEVIKQNSDELTDLFFTRIEKTIKNYPLIEENTSLFLKQITYNFWNMLYLYYVQKTFKIERSKKTLQDFFNSCSRILEFAIYIHSKNLSNFQKIYFNIEIIEVCFFKNFLEIKIETILKNHKDLFVVKKDSLNNKKTVFIENKFKYIPQSKPMQEINKNNLNDTFWFERHFRLDDNQVIKIFAGTGSQGGSNKNNYLKSNSINYKDFDVHEYIDELNYSNFDYEKLEVFEENIETRHRAYQIPSLLLDKKAQNILNIKIKESYTKNNYKQYLINRAISNNITKNNIFLSSKVLNFNLFKTLIETLLKHKENYHICIILLSIFTGIQVKLLILIFTKTHKNIIFEESNIVKLIIKNNDIFAKNVIEDEDILIPIKSNMSQIYLPQTISDMAKYIKNKLQFIIKNKMKCEKKKDFTEYEKNIENELKLISKSLKKIINTSKASNFNNIDIKSCHKAFYNYFCIFHKETDIRILFFDNLSKNNEARVCYTAQQKRLIYFEFWLNEFYSKLTDEFSVAKDFNQGKDFIGSKKVVKEAAFKNFLLNLTLLNPKDFIEKVNLQMIFIRYALSILLATRSTYDSCNLINFSKKLELLTIHEKAKSITSSKRLIPLTKRALLLIQMFYRLKEEFKLTSFLPVLLEVKENEIKENELKPNSVNNFIEIFKSHPKYEELKKFIDTVDLNFGRHIFATEALKNGFNREYENEFMGHYSKGNSGFGIYSNLEVKNYINDTREFLEEIENKYFPKYIDIGDIK